MRFAATLVLTLLAVVISTQASAAVRLCSESLAGDTGKGATELIAKKAALKDWFAKAKTAGYADAIWPAAAGKQLSCVKAGKGFECIAVARACTIAQKAPDGFVPAPRVKTQPTATLPETPNAVPDVAANGMDDAPQYAPPAGADPEN